MCAVCKKKITKAQEAPTILEGRAGGCCHVSYLGSFLLSVFIEVARSGRTAVWVLVVPVGINLQVA